MATVGLWLGQFSLQTVQLSALMGGFEATLLPPRMVSTTAAILMSLGIAAIIFRPRQYSLIRQGLIGFCCVVVATMVHAAVNVAAVLTLLPPSHQGDITIAAYTPAMIQWFWSYFALVALLIAIKYVLQVEENERRIASLERSALELQMAALRYQLNPHFIFNAMNSIVALIGEQRNDDAEAMVENLADFFRRTLELEPQETVSITEELALRDLYLNIERARFSDRLVVETFVAPDVKEAMVPALITQPLVENAVRHAVAMSSKPVHLRTAVNRSGASVSIEIRNTLVPGKARPGPGVGLANIAAGLDARYGAAASLECGPVGNEFVAIVKLPFEPRPC